MEIGIYIAIVVIIVSIIIDIMIIINHIKKKTNNREFSDKKTNLSRKVKRCIIFGLVFIILGIIYIGLSLSFPNKSIDFISKYKNYLDYSLGSDWKVLEVNKNKLVKGIWFTEYYYWTISYKDKNNENQILKIDNAELRYYKNEELYSDYIFSLSIIYSYRQKVNDILRKSNISALDREINIIDLYSNHKDYDYLFSKDTLKIIDARNGLSFQDISLEKMDKDYYFLELTNWNSGININKYTIEESKKIIDKFDIKNAIISTENNGSGVPIYCIKDRKEISCPSESDLSSMIDALINEKNYISLK